MIGSYSWSLSPSGPSIAQSGDTYCSGCTVNVSDVAMSNSVAASNTKGGLWDALYALLCWRCVRGCTCVLRWLCIDLHAQVEAVPSERLYGQCSAASALCVRLTMAAQVYGGSLSLVVGAYLWSKSQQAYSTCNAGATVVFGLWTELNNIRISGSQAGTYSTFAHSSKGSNVRLAQRLSRAPFQFLM